MKKNRTSFNINFDKDEINTLTNLTLKKHLVFPRSTEYKILTNVKNNNETGKMTLNIDDIYSLRKLLAKIIVIYIETQYIDKIKYENNINTLRRCIAQLDKKMLIPNINIKNFVLEI
jgi:hypothetical protein